MKERKLYRNYIRMMLICLFLNDLLFYYIILNVGFCLVKFFVLKIILCGLSCFIFRNNIIFYLLYFVDFFGERGLKFVIWFVS